MKDLPAPDVYTLENRYMPWGKLIERVVQIVSDGAPKNGNVVDLMCGPGFLVNKLTASRPDLSVTGIDIDSRFIDFALNHYYRNANFVKADVLKWKNGKKHDVVICTAGLHHIPYSKQSLFLRNIKDIMYDNGFGVIADPVIGEYGNEYERKSAAAKLGYEYLNATIRNGAPNDVIKAALDIMHNDIFGFKFKTSYSRLNRLLFDNFSNVRAEKVWPSKELNGFGDYIFTVRK